MGRLDTFKYDIKKSTKLTEIDLDTLIDNAKILAEELRKTKTHQIRRFFDAIKNIKVAVDTNKALSGEDKTKLLMLRPQFENAAQKQAGLRELTDICSAMIKKIKESKFDDKEFLHFANFFESLVAFHKVSAER